MSRYWEQQLREAHYEMRLAEYEREAEHTPAVVPEPIDEQAMPEVRYRYPRTYLVQFRPITPPLVRGPSSLPFCDGALRYAWEPRVNLTHIRQAAVEAHSWQDARRKAVVALGVSREDYEPMGETDTGHGLWMGSYAVDTAYELSPDERALSATWLRSAE